MTTTTHTSTAFAVLDILHNGAMLAPLNNRGALVPVLRNELPEDTQTGDTLHQLPSGEYIIGYRQLDDVQAAYPNAAATIMRASLYTLAKHMGISEAAARGVMQRFLESEAHDATHL